MESSSPRNGLCSPNPCIQLTVCLLCFIGRCPVISSELASGSTGILLAWRQLAVCPVYSVLKAWPQSTSRCIRSCYPAWLQVTLIHAYSWQFAYSVSLDDTQLSPRNLLPAQLGLYLLEYHWLPFFRLSPAKRKHVSQPSRTLGFHPRFEVTRLLRRQRVFLLSLRLSCTITLWNFR